MEKSAAFMLGVEYAFEKQAFFGPFKKKIVQVAKKTAPGFKGHAAEMGKALATKKDARGIVSKKVLDKATGKYRVVRHIEL